MRALVDIAATTRTSRASRASSHTPTRALVGGAVREIARAPRHVDSTAGRSGLAWVLPCRNERPRHDRAHDARARWHRCARCTLRYANATTAAAFDKQSDKTAGDAPTGLLLCNYYYQPATRNGYRALVTVVRSLCRYEDREKPRGEAARGRGKESGRRWKNGGLGPWRIRQRYVPLSAFTPTTRCGRVFGSPAYEAQLRYERAQLGHCSVWLKLTIEPVGLNRR